MTCPRAHGQKWLVGTGVCTMEGRLDLEGGVGFREVEAWFAAFWAVEVSLTRKPLRMLPKAQGAPWGPTTGLVMPDGCGHQCQPVRAGGDHG